MQVKFTDYHLFVRTPVVDKEFVQDRLHGVWSSGEGMHRFPKNLYAMSELLQTYPVLANNFTFMDMGKRMAQTREKYLALKQLNDASIDVPELRPYQRADVAYLMQWPAAGVFNEPRTGKTPTIIVTLKLLGILSNLIVVPAGLVLNWEKEFKVWWPECRVFTVYGLETRRMKLYNEFLKQSKVTPCALIISKDTLKEGYDDEGKKHTKDYGVLHKHLYGSIIVDEAHFLRVRDSDQSEAIFRLKHHASQRRYPMTGTPAVKHPSDLYGILHFLNPKKHSSFWQFVDRFFAIPEKPFASMVGKKHSKANKDYSRMGRVLPHRLQEFQELVFFNSVQRKRSEVMPWLPQKQRIPHLCLMEGKQMSLYRQMEQTFMACDGDIVIDTPNVLSQLMRMRQLCLDPALLGFNVKSAKTSALIEWLSDNNEPVVVMSMFTSYLELLKPKIEKLGKRVGTIIGEGMSKKAQEDAKERFQRGECDVLLCQIVSAGVGHTLDRAETVIFTDLAWNPADNEQAEDRITPVTEERNHAHNIITFVCPDTVDARINEILAEKKELTDYVNNAGREAIRRLTYGTQTVQD